LQIKTKIVSCHTADSKPAKQEVNGTVILPPLVFPAAGMPGLISPKEGGGGAVNGDNLNWAEFLPLKLISDMIFNLKNIICNLISHLN
jgi:hypothetical protein